MSKSGVFTCGTLAVILAASFLTALAGDSEIDHVTPIPLSDANPDLRILYFGAESDYFISTYEADAETAHQVCQRLTDLTGKPFQLLTVEKLEEADELQSHLQTENITGIWTTGVKGYDGEGKISLYWNRDVGSEPMEFKNFRQGLVRKRREVTDSYIPHDDNQSHSDTHQPWLRNGRCRNNARFMPSECEPVQCNVTMPDCSTITPPCEITDEGKCSVQRPSSCTAKCENCTVIQPVCFATPQPCTVKAQDCLITRPPCEVVTPPCYTTRPPCKTVQPPCEVSTPPPCSTEQPCIPTFKKDNCTTETLPCKTNKRNETVCPPPKTVCEPDLRCPEPVICQSPAIICPPPLIYCEPETTVCPPPKIKCEDPIIYCPTPEVDCPEPVVKCTKPQVLCSPPVVNCPPIVTACTAPDVDCPPPQVTCPDPCVTCTKPEPCIPSTSTPFPPCTTEAPEPSTTTSKPCPGCGCVLISKKHDLKWDIQNCSTKNHFICEG